MNYIKFKVGQWLFKRIDGFFEPFITAMESSPDPIRRNWAWQARESQKRARATEARIERIFESIREQRRLQKSIKRSRRMVERNDRTVLKRLRAGRRGR